MVAKKSIPNRTHTYKKTVFLAEKRPLQPLNEIFVYSSGATNYVNCRSLSVVALSAQWLSP